jgi:hypothetical protein
MPVRFPFAKRVCLVICMASAGAEAIDEGGNYAVWGIGQASCNQFVKALEADDVQNYSTYLAGYLTAFNTLSPGIHSATGRATAADNLRRIGDYCADHRMDSFERAIQSMVKEASTATVASAKEAPSSWGRPAAPPSPQR